METLDKRNNNTSPQGKGAIFNKEFCLQPFERIFEGMKRSNFQQGVLSANHFKRSLKVWYRETLRKKFPHGSKNRKLKMILTSCIDTPTRISIACIGSPTVTCLCTSCTILSIKTFYSREKYSK